MFNPKSFLILAGILFLYSNASNAQWKAKSVSQSMSHVGKADASISNAAVLTLDPKFISDISSLEISQTGQRENESIVVQLPLPDGHFYTVRLHQTALLHPDLLKKYPGILSYTGYGVDDVNAVVKCSLGEDGFHAMIISSKYGNIYIDPLGGSTSGDYICYYKKDYTVEGKKAFECGVKNSGIDINHHKADAQYSFVPDCTLRKYRLALACTGEYAAYHGGTVTKVLSAMNTTMTRVSGVYERDLSVTFQIIPDNDKLIFLNAQTDPYTNNNGGSMLGQNQTTVDDIIGNDNYDIGHVFSTGGGGIASLSAVCNKDYKARGVTGSSKPIGDPYDIDYVCHEMGHQFNANHTFNNTCGGNINAITAYEPGSGSTIMGYAGVCTPNIQFNSDSYFHTVSLGEISTYITQLAGNVCPEKINVNNVAPTVNAGPDRIIPVKTPFELTATGYDADGDSLSYCWEQLDNELVTHPPVNTYTNGPSFRSFYPTADSTRVFPQISTIINNTTSTWEVLPAAGRNLNFAVTARDNHPGGGCFGTDEMLIKVDDNSGPFLVTKPNTNLTWTIGTDETITWDVAKTNLFPVNCFTVDIYLSSDGGYTYPVLLANDVPNNGSYTVQVPNKPGTKSRVKVKAHGNVFFDISNQNFTIKEPATPSVFVSLDKNKQIVCTENTGTTQITASIVPLTGFTEEVSITIDSLPAGVTADIQPQTTNLPADVTITLSGLEALSNGTYSMYIKATSASVTKSVAYTLGISTGKPGDVKMLKVPAKSKNVSINPQLSWNSLPGVKSYRVIVASDYNFTKKVLDTQVLDTMITVNGLDYYSVYFWKVSANNDCGEGTASETRAFQTVNKICKEYVQNTPVTIPNNKIFNGTSILSIADSIKISEMTVKVKANHSYLTDLSLEIQAPDNQSVTLFSNGCDGLKDIDAVFSDNGLKLNCSPISPAVSGLVKPASGNFYAFSGNNLYGTWTMKIGDNYPQDGGELQSWSINTCAIDTTYKSPLVSNNQVLYILENTTEKLDSSYLLSTIENTAASGIRYFVTQTTQNGQFRKGINVLKVGDWFTQADINNKLVSYKNSGAGNGTDTLRFYVQDINGNWTPDQHFDIVILKPLKAVAMAEDVLCYGESNGKLNIQAEFGLQPYQYSLNGSAFADSSSFGGLIAGEYTFQVKDALGQTVTGNQSIQQPDSLVLNIIKQGYNVSLNISGGVPPYLAGTDGVNFAEVSTFENLSIGKYIFFVKDQNDCVISDSVNIVTAVHEAAQLDFSIFPVPADGFVNVRITSPEPTYISIADCMGRIMQKWEKPTGEQNLVQLDIRHLATGLYLLKIESRYGSVAKKLLVQH